MPIVKGGVLSWVTVPDAVYEGQNIPEAEKFLLLHRLQDLYT